MKRSSLIQLSISGFVLFLGIRGLIFGHSDPNKVAGIPLMLLSGYVLTFIAAVCLIGLVANLFTRVKR